MSIRKRKWTTTKGEKKEAWIVDYVDQDGDRHIRTFEKKRDADAYHATVNVDVRQGVHSAPSKSITLARAAEDWLSHVAREGRERSTIARRCARGLPLPCQRRCHAAPSPAGGHRAPSALGLRRSHQTAYRRCARIPR